jgi:hypothetical protein
MMIASAVTRGILPRDRLDVTPPPAQHDHAGRPEPFGEQDPDMPLLSRRCSAASAPPAEQDQDATDRRHGQQGDPQERAIRLAITMLVKRIPARPQ